jgi:hypothetical protein
MKMSNRTNGQALQEYGLVIGLVVLTAVSGLAILSPQVVQSMTDSLSPQQPLKTLTAVEAGQVMANLQPMESPSANNNIADPGGDLLRDGALTQTIAQDQNRFLNPVQSLRNTVADAIETIGTDGTTHELANALFALTKPVEGEPPLSEEQMALFDRLANQGHRLAKIQANIKFGAGKGTIRIDNQNISAQDAAIAIGASVDPQNRTGKNTHISQFSSKVIKELGLERLRASHPYFSPELSKFVKEYSALRQSIPESNGRVKEQLQRLSKALLDVNNTFAGKVFVAAENGVGVKAIEKSMVDEFTDKQSAEICNSDSRTADTGKHCQVR